MKRTIKLHTGATKVVEDATHKIMTIQEWREEGKDVLVRTTWIGSLSALCADILHQSGILKRPEPKDQTVPARSALEDIRERGPEGGRCVWLQLGGLWTLWYPEWEGDYCPG